MRVAAVDAAEVVGEVVVGEEYRAAEVVADFRAAEGVQYRAEEVLVAVDSRGAEAV